MYTPKLLKSEIGREKWGSYVVGNSNLYFDNFLSAPEGIKIKFSVHNLAMLNNMKDLVKKKNCLLPLGKKTFKMDKKFGE